MTLHSRRVSAFVLALSIGAALATMPSCKSSEQPPVAGKSSPRGYYTLLAGTTLELTSPLDGTRLTFTVDGGAILSKDYVHLYLDFVEAGGWMDVVVAKRGEPAGTYSIAPARYSDSPEGPILQPGAAGTLSASANFKKPKSDAYLIYDSSGDGSATITSPAGWPTAAGEALDMEIEFVLVPLKPNAAISGGDVGVVDAASTTDAGGDAGAPGASPSLAGKLHLRLGIGNLNTDCTSPAGGAGCVDFKTCNTKSECTCAGAECTKDHRCCIPNGGTCGSAGTGSECCSRFCSGAGRCEPNFASACADGGTGGDGGTAKCLPNGTTLTFETKGLCCSGCPGGDKCCGCMAQACKADSDCCSNHCNLGKCCELDSTGTGFTCCRPAGDSYSTVDSCCSGKGKETEAPACSGCPGKGTCL
jgi:hypothetical protein